jgi:tRNA A37 threonylcarbamoyladenosine synthetase subunit TsaC/SUA5/YrdC
MVTTEEFNAMLKTLYDETQQKKIDELKNRIQHKTEIALINSKKSTKEVLLC